MNKLIYCFLMFNIQFACAQDSFLGTFMPKRLASLPFSVGKDSYLHNSFKDVDQRQIKMLVSRLADVADFGIFNARSDFWKNSYNPPIRRIKTTEIRCVEGVRCVLFSAKNTWLITMDSNGNLLDAAILYAVNTAFDDVGKTVRVAEMDTTFGLGGYFARGLGWSINFEESGVFCSSYSKPNLLPEAVEYRVFKRRVNKQGRIEFKEIPGWDQCKLPW